jgi:hypothetical protein
MFLFGNKISFSMFVSTYFSTSAPTQPFRKKCGKLD